MEDNTDKGDTDVGDVLVVRMGFSEKVKFEQRSEEVRGWATWIRASTQRKQGCLSHGSKKANVAGRGINRRKVGVGKG